MHRNLRYGAASRKFAPTVAGLIEERRPTSILDYGAGKGALAECLGDQLDGIAFAEYDPGVAAISKLPKGAFDMVCCIDVLEHIEPQFLENVLASIASKTAVFAFLTIHTGPAGKTLSDGRNAHLIQEPVKWWRRQLKPHFGRMEIAKVSETTYSVTCEARR